MSIASIDSFEAEPEIEGYLWQGSPPDKEIVKLEIREGFM
jgi:hypothetical protein